MHFCYARNPFFIWSTSSENRDNMQHLNVFRFSSILKTGKILC